MVLGSLAYRKNKDAIWKADIPLKYKRLIDYVPGKRVLELGAAEGVLALMMAQRKEKVFALEMRKERHEEAIKLQEQWRQLGYNVDRCEMVHGNIFDRLDLLQQVDCFVGVRSIYYLRDRIDEVFMEISRHVSHVMLSGNEERARTYFKANGNPDDKLGKYNFYASAEGMKSLLERTGFKISHVIDDGDPVVIAQK